ncbi:hypothetical protein PR048_018756 [Dryococelus australis]|uniref:Uncharacterized protein n=1 Tax=Dryococelus australis TaxID=614101 RepID=A0ABQ9HD82_9NEOP|nr:hypothetical protein PR048_018756 [Dryococelus australis]
MIAVQWANYYESELDTYNESVKRLGSHHNESVKRRSSHHKWKKEKKCKTSNPFEKCNNIDNDEKINKHKKKKLFTENPCDNTLIFSGISVTSEDFHSVSNPKVYRQQKGESSSKESTQLHIDTEESNVELSERFPKSRKKNKYKSNSEAEESLALQENNREHRKRKREGTKSSFETSAELSEQEHVINIKKNKHEKKRRKLGINVEKAEPNPKDDCVITGKNIHSVAHLETRKRNVTEIHATDNSITDSFGDFMQIEEEEKKKKKSECVSGEEGANTHHHSLIGISVDVETRNKNEKDRTYRFTIPADFGMKNKKTSHRRKLSLNVNM